MPGTAQQFLGVLRGYLGIQEAPSGSNRTVLGEAFGWNGVPWCAITQSLALRRVGIDFWTASTDLMEKMARKGHNGSRWLSSTSIPRPGDLAIWDWIGDGTPNHVSAVESVNSNGTFVTIGGNESNRVQRAVRSRRGLRGFIRPPFATQASAPKPPAPTVSVKHPVLSLGSRGISVKELQTKLNKVTGSKLVVDGDFGPATKRMVQNFQAYFKLNADGIVGPKTWGLLDYTYALANKR